MSGIRVYQEKFPVIFEDEEENFKFQQFIMEFIKHLMERLDLISLAVNRKIEMDGELAGFRSGNICRTLGKAVAFIPTKGPTIEMEFAETVVGLNVGDLVKKLICLGFDKLAEWLDRKIMNKKLDYFLKFCRRKH